MTVFSATQIARIISFNKEVEVANTRVRYEGVVRELRIVFRMSSQLYYVLLDEQPVSGFLEDNFSSGYIGLDFLLDQINEAFGSV